MKDWSLPDKSWYNNHTGQEYKPETIPLKTAATYVDKIPTPLGKITKIQMTVGWIGGEGFKTFTSSKGKVTLDADFLITITPTSDEDINNVEIYPTNGAVQIQTVKIFYADLSGASSEFFFTNKSQWSYVSERFQIDVKECGDNKGFGLNSDRHATIKSLLW